MGGRSHKANKYLIRRLEFITFLLLKSAPLRQIIDSTSSTLFIKGHAQNNQIFILRSFSISTR